ncbi:MAG: protein phosphatase 2C domain-containing protein [Stigonema ocellatum SAG 48.90 = DSM 106950]|nr:protein phosphatase 2C domain-containing protein [Stigonema ocellatum SAG 48.90 = DSM 106950]
MQCPKCGSTVQVDDCFCEECGTPLIAVSESTQGCSKCGAGPEAMDADGFCSNCGFRRQTRQDDRLEVVRSPNLALITDRGLKHHRNEDYVACAQVDDRNAYILVVCDGVSSSSSPDIAAKTAAQSACRVLTTAVETVNLRSRQEVMKLAIAEAMTSVCAIPYTKTMDADPPSTTIVAALVVDRTATIGWLGDSRAYWISPNGSRQLTRDDSWLSDVVLSGEITESEARKSPQAHAITRWLGVDAVNVEPSVVNFDIPGFGHLLLCTDGLWNYVPAMSQIDDLLKSHADAVTVARKLVEFALRCGGHDNISVAVLSL